MLGQKILVPKSLGLKNCSVQKSLGETKFLSNTIWALKKLSPKSLLNILSVTAEIFLIWTKVARKNVAWTNVNGISSRWSQESTF